MATADELVPDWTPTRCPRCGGPLVQVGDALLPRRCRACRLNIVPMGSSDAG
jgi:hypothetical protein